MAKISKIEWTDSTFNPWIGCTRVSPGCDHCYAAVSTPARTKGIQWGPNQQRQRTADRNWREPFRWNEEKFFECPDCGLRGTRHALEKGPKGEFACHHMRAQLVRRRVFCASLADVFDNEVPVAWRVDALDVIRRTKNLDWLVVTKRIGNVVRMLEEARDAAQVGADQALVYWLSEWIEGRPPAHVWLLATIVNQEEADRDIPKLLATPAAIRGLSMEPLLGPVDLTGFWSKQTGRKAIAGPIPSDYYSFLHWVIVGGESGAGARPMHPDWARSLREQCAAAGVPFLFKQWGEWAPEGQFSSLSLIVRQGEAIPKDLKYQVLEGNVLTTNIGKHKAGRELDGRTWDGYPRSPASHG